MEEEKSLSKEMWPVLLLSGIIISGLAVAYIYLNCVRGDAVVSPVLVDKFKDL
jgi:hypothetical protein